MTTCEMPYFDRSTQEIVRCQNQAVYAIEATAEPGRTMASRCRIHAHDVIHVGRLLDGTVKYRMIRLPGV